MNDFLSYQATIKNASPHTITAYFHDIHNFKRFIGLGILAITRTNIRTYLAHLRDVGASRATVLRRISTLRSLYGFLVRFRYLAESPTKYLESPRPIRNLPPIMDVPTMYRLMKLPNTRTWGGSRDLAMLEVLYSSGVRLSELVGIKLGDLDLGKGTFIVNGKGGQQRECYLNSSARRALRHYLKMTRVSREERIFLNPFGRPITGRSVERIVNAYISRVDSRPGLTVHSIRHTFATHMLESGVNIRDIQEMLGHKNISTTAHYLHISVKHLKQQYDAHMPSILNGQMSLFLTAKGG